MQSRSILINDLKAVINGGLYAKVKHLRGPTARDVCRHYLKIASTNASAEEKSYLPIIKKRVEEGNLSTIISRSINQRAGKTDTHEAIVKTYENLVKCLKENRLHSRS